MYRKYYSYNDMPKPVLSSVPTETEKELKPIKKEPLPPAKIDVKKDDIIIIAVLLTLILNGCDDKLLIIAVAALLVI